MNTATWLRRFLLKNQRSGAWALLEFFTFGVSIAAAKWLSSLSLDHTVFLIIILLVGLLGLLSFFLWIIHSAVTISRRRWDPWFSVMSLIVIYFLAQVLAVAIVVPVYLLLIGSNQLANTQLDNSIGAQFLLVLMAETLTLSAIYGYMRLFSIKLRDICLKKPRWVDPLYGLAAVPAYYIVYLIVVGLASHYITGLNIDQQQDIGFNNVSGGLEMVLTFISLVVLPPLAEEIMVRGFLYSSLKKAMKIIPAAIITSLIFAAAHLPEGGPAGPLYIAAIDTFVLSLFLIYLREKTGSLWASITLHAIKNGVAFVALFVLHAH